MKNLFFVILILFIFSACKKQVEKERPEFIGRWHCEFLGNYINLKISEDSYATYEIYYEGKTNSHQGIARANDNHLKIGRIIHFNILEYPHMIDTTRSDIYVYTTDSYNSAKKANWKMVISGLEPFFSLRVLSNITKQIIKI
jgi:hypothetical protein